MKLAAWAAIAAGWLSVPAIAQTCPSGDALYAAFEKDYSSSNDTRARAILYWQDTGASAVDHLGKIYTSLSECRKGLCNTGEEDFPEVAAYKQYYSDTFKRENGYSDKAPVYAGFDAPPHAMLNWAEQRLGCTAGPTLAERTAAAAAKPAPLPAPAPQVAATQPVQPEPQPASATPVMYVSEPVSACNLTPEELEHPQTFYNRDNAASVIAWWTLKGKQALPRITSFAGPEWSAQAFGPYFGSINKVRQGELNAYGVPYDKKIVRAMKKYKEFPLERVPEYPPYEAIVRVTQTYGDCFGERSASIDFEEIGLIRGNFSAAFCNSAAASPEVDNFSDPRNRGIYYWGKAQLADRYDKSCGYVPAKGYEFALNDTGAGAEAAEFARAFAEEKQRQYNAAIRGQKMFQKAYEEGAEARAAIAAEKRAKQAAEQQARQQAADAAYNDMINQSQNQKISPPPSNRRECFDQGDGTEKCFYD